MVPDTWMACLSLCINAQRKLLMLCSQTIFDVHGDLSNGFSGK
jgi:hypothetical protein